MDVDVIVVGAGPAGCAAAISCIHAGLSVLMIAGKENIPTTSNNPTPSESIHPGVLSLLAQIHATNAVDAASTGIYEGVQTGNAFSRLSDAEEFGPWLGHHINRAQFDASLLEAAIEQGVDILKNEMVTSFLKEDGFIIGVETNKEQKISCKYTIDASGYKRIGGKRLKFKEIYYSLPLTAWTGVAKNIRECDPIFENRFTKFIPAVNGWTWLAPEPPDKCTWTKLSAKGKQLLTMPSELEAYINTENINAANCRWRIFRPVCQEGIVLCGDAAGIIDPAAGQGILIALLSGINAAKAVASCINDADHEALYLASYDDWFFQYYHNKVQKLKQHYTDLGILLF